MRSFCWAIQGTWKCRQIVFDWVLLTSGDHGFQLIEGYNRVGFFTVGNGKAIGHKPAFGLRWFASSISALPSASTPRAENVAMGSKSAGSRILRVGHLMAHSSGMLAGTEVADSMRRVE